VSDSGISWAVCKSAPRSRQITTQNIQQNIYTSKYRPSNLTVRLTVSCPAVTNIENVDCGHWASLGMSKYDPQNCYIQWGSRPLPQTWLPWWWAEPPRVHILNGISLNGNSHPFSRARQPVQPVPIHSRIVALCLWNNTVPIHSPTMTLCCVPKKLDMQLLGITSANVHRFSTFFHWHLMAISIQA